MSLRQLKIFKCYFILQIANEDDIIVFNFKNLWMQNLW